jgi:hypothetical protein
MFSQNISINSNFSKNINSFLVSVSESAETQFIQNMYTKLSIVVQTINTLMTEYSKGNFYAVANILTQDNYNIYSIRLSNLEVNPIKYPEYETLRKSSTSALTGLYQSIIQYSNYLNLEEQLRVSQERESILYNPTLLSEFISKMQQNRQLFPDSTVNAPMATLKPEYAAYINLYGFPQGGAFDPDRLAYILQNM